MEHPPLARVSIDRRLTARAGIALVLANMRYWRTVAPSVRAQLDHWRERARLIPDPALRELALENLSEEGFNAEAGATLATLTPRAQRVRAVEAIVAFQVMYDYLDGLVEQPSDEPLRNGRQLLKALVDAVSQPPQPGADADYYRYNRRTEDGGYLQSLISTIGGAIGALPASSAFADVIRAAAARCAEGQAQTHAAKRMGTAQLEEWAKREAAGTALDWHEFFAGTLTSVISIYALLATADERTTPQQAAAIDATYLSIGALSTILDSLVDHEQDLAGENVGYVSRHYPDPDTLARRLANLIGLVVVQARTLPNAAHHIMTLAGVVAYYTSSPAASGDFARPTAIRTQRELAPLITPVLAVMRTWRFAKRTRRWRRHEPASTRESPQTDAQCNWKDPRGAGKDVQQRPIARRVAIITDGNGRWARARGLPAIRGHEAGADTLKARIRDAAELGIRELTVYSFSTENWSRSEEEVQGLISMFARRIAEETPGLHRQGVRMRFTGRREGISQKLLQQMCLAEAMTAENEQMTLFIALNYGGRAEILDAARTFAGTTEQEFHELLYAPDMHDPDLIIRTSGEQRLSNFLLWQSARSQLVFRKELWPDFTRECLAQTLDEYSKLALGAEARARGSSSTS